MKLRLMTIYDYDECMSIWKQMCPNSLCIADERQRLAHYLERNNHLSYVACVNKQVVGSVLCGHDGRLGYMYHLAVLPKYHNTGLINQLAQKALDGLMRENIHICHILVYEDNLSAQQTWSALGWTKQDNLLAYTTTLTA